MSSRRPQSAGPTRSGRDRLGSAGSEGAGIIHELSPGAALRKGIESGARDARAKAQAEAYERAQLQRKQALLHTSAVERRHELIRQMSAKRSEELDRRTSQTAASRDSSTFGIRRPWSANRRPGKQVSRRPMSAQPSRRAANPGTRAGHRPSSGRSSRSHKRDSTERHRHGSSATSTAEYSGSEDSDDSDEELKAALARRGPESERVPPKRSALKRPQSALPRQRVPSSESSSSRSMVTREVSEQPANSEQVGTQEEQLVLSDHAAPSESDNAQATTARDRAATTANRFKARPQSAHPRANPSAATSIMQSASDDTETSSDDDAIPDLRSRRATPAGAPQRVRPHTALVGRKLTADARQTAQQAVHHARSRRSDTPEPTKPLTGHITSVSAYLRAKEEARQVVAISARDSIASSGAADPDGLVNAPEARRSRAMRFTMSAYRVAPPHGAARYTRRRPRTAEEHRRAVAASARRSVIRRRTNRRKQYLAMRERPVDRLGSTVSTPHGTATNKPMAHAPAEQPDKAGSAATAVSDAEAGTGDGVAGSTPRPDHDGTTPTDSAPDGKPLVVPAVGASNAESAAPHGRTSTSKAETPSEEARQQARRVTLAPLFSGTAVAAPGRGLDQPPLPLRLDKRGALRALLGASNARSVHRRRVVPGKLAVTDGGVSPKAEALEDPALERPTSESAVHATVSGADSHAYHDRIPHVEPKAPSHTRVGPHPQVDSEHGLADPTVPPHTDTVSRPGDPASDTQHDGVEPVSKSVQFVAVDTEAAEREAGGAGLPETMLSIASAASSESQKEKDEAAQRKMFHTGAARAAANVFRSEAAQRRLRRGTKADKQIVLMWSEAAKVNFVQLDRVVVRVMPAPDGSAAYAVGVSSTGSFIAVGNGDSFVRTYTVPVESSQRTRLRRKLESDTGPILAVSISPDDKHLAATGADKSVRIWRIDTGVLIVKCHYHTERAMCLDWSSDGRMVASAGADKHIAVWDTRKALATDPAPKDITVKRTRRRITDCLMFACEPEPLNVGGHSACIRRVRFTPDSSLLLSAGDDKSIRVWSAEPDDPGELLHVYNLHRRHVYAMDISPEATMVASAGEDRMAVIFILGGEGAGTLKHVLSGQNSIIYDCKFSPEQDGRRLITAGHNGSVYVWDTETGGVLQKIEKAHQTWVHSLAWAPSGLRFVSSGGDGSVHAWRPGTDKRLRAQVRTLGAGLSKFWKKLRKDGQGP